MTVEDLSYFCPWEGRRVSPGHECIGGGEGPTPCPNRRENGSACGECSVCLAAQLAEVQRWGSPGDLSEGGC